MWPVARASQPVNLGFVAKAGSLANMGKMPMPRIGYIATGSERLGWTHSDGTKGGDP